MRRWKVIEWDVEPTGSLPLACPKCGKDSAMPTHGEAGALIVAAIALRLILEPAGHVPPPSFMPQTIQCPHCWASFTSAEEEGAR